MNPLVVAIRTASRRKSSVYLFAIIYLLHSTHCSKETGTKTRQDQWATRKVLAWRLSNTLDASFCVEALNEAITKYGKPEIMNTYQGSQFTGAAWITALNEADIKISMDGRGRYLDNIFIERLWRSLKQEAVYLHELQDGFQAKRVIKDWIGFYNSERPHTALDKRSQTMHSSTQNEPKRRHETKHDYILARP